MSTYHLKNGEPSLQTSLELQQHPQIGKNIRLTYQGRALERFQIMRLIDLLFQIGLIEQTRQKYSINVQSFSEYPEPLCTLLVDIECNSENEAREILAIKKEYEQKLQLELASPSRTKYPSSCEVIQDKSWQELKELLIRISPHISHFALSQILEEALRIFLATDREFKKIRPVKALARLALSHIALRKSLPTLYPQKGTEKVKTRMWPTTLIFPFGGHQKTLSLAISLSALSCYEQFELQHILHACKRIIPSIKTVPNSYYFYRHPRDSSWNFYVELEKEKSIPFQTKEIFSLKKKVAHELSSSIEKVMNTIEIPYNEEETLRSIRTLSHELTAKNPIPQVLIQFQKQNACSLIFDLYLIKLVKENELFALKDGEKIISSGLVTIKLQRQEIVGKTRHKHVKLLFIYEASCDKKTLIQQDYSINFIQARELVLDAVRSHIGIVRDVNGGFLSEQKNLLLAVKYSITTPLRDKEEPLLEKFIRNLKPSFGKSTQEQSVLFPLANLLIQFHREELYPQKCPIRFQESEEALYLVIQKHSDMTPDYLLLKPTILKSKEIEFFHSYCTHEGIAYVAFLFLSSDNELKKEILSWYQNRIHSHLVQTKKLQGILISLPRPIQLLDPRIGTDRTSSVVIQMLYEGLMTHDFEGKLIYGIAQSASISPDGTQYTFCLREAYWSNGQRVTAHDFEYAWKKMLDPSFKTLYGYIFHPIKNARAMKEGTKSSDEVGITALDDTTLRVELEKPCSYFKELLSHWIFSPLCHTTDTARPGWAFFGAETHVCNGPFRLSRWIRNDEIEAVKNEWYWNKDDVKPERIHIKVIEDPNLAWDMFTRDELDWIGEPLSPIPFSIIRSQPQGLQNHEMRAVQWMVFNTSRTFFSNPKARHAFSLALDRKNLGKVIHTGCANPCSSLIHSSLSFLNKNPLPYDPLKAKLLFDESVQELGIPPSLISLKMRVYNSEILVAIARHAAAEWQKLFGIHIELEILEWYTFFDSLSEYSYDILTIMWYSWMDYAPLTFESLISKNRTMNLSQWESSSFQEVIKALIMTPDEESKKCLSAKAESILLEEMPIAPIFEYRSQFAKNSNLNNVYLSPHGNINFRWAYYKETST